MKQSYTTYFAEIYDDVMQHVPYNYWFRYLNDLLKYYQHQPKSILELASGTSNMTLHLLKLNSVKKITALDLSEAMLSKAAEKLKVKMAASSNYQILEQDKKEFKYKIKSSKKEIEIDFLNKNMSDFIVDSNYDLVLSFFDSINYLTDIDKLSACFQNTAAALNENGLFIFDMNSIGRINTIEENSYIFKGAGYECFWEDIVKTKENLWQVKLKICPKNNKLPCFEEIHSERGYKIAAVLRLLKNSGFKAVKVYNAFSFRRGKDNSRRLYFAAALNKDRLEEHQNFFKKVYYGIKNEIDYFFVNLKNIF